MEPTDNTRIELQRMNQSGEDYLEAILELENGNKGVRSVDIAKHLGVSKPSVNKAMGLLKAEGFIDQQPYSDIVLTERGRAYAEKVLYRHKLLKEFIVDILHLDEETGEKEACLIEHIISYQTVCALREHIAEVKRYRAENEK